MSIQVPAGSKRTHSDQGRSIIGQLLGFDVVYFRNIDPGGRSDGG